MSHGLQVLEVLHSHVELPEMTSHKSFCNFLFFLMLRTKFGLGFTHSLIYSNNNVNHNKIFISRKTSLHVGHVLSLEEGAQNN